MNATKQNWKLPKAERTARANTIKHLNRKEAELIDRINRARNEITCCEPELRQVQAELARLQ